MGRRFVVEADGAARGNPGPASYGALVRDAETGQVLVECGETLGVATNNVAEYSGLIAGLRAAFALDPGAEVEVRMDSKLVIEQMSGRWAIKNANLKPLALSARDAIPNPSRMTWTWIPRAENSHADRLANAALDGKPIGVPSPAEADPRPSASSPSQSSPSASSPSPSSPAAAPMRVVSAQPGADEVAVTTGPAPKIIGWATDLGHVTTLTLLRHGETEHTVARRFSGTGYDPPLSDRGADQAEVTARHLKALGGIEAVVASPLRRAQQTAAAVAAAFGLPVQTENDLRECDFGAWDGLTFTEVQQQWAEHLTAWLADPELAPPGGESLSQVAERVADAHRRLLADHDGRHVLVVAHVGSIKQIVRLGLGAPLATVHRLQLAPASLSTVRWYADGNSALHGFNDVGHLGELARIDGS